MFVCDIILLIASFTIIFRQNEVPESKVDIYPDFASEEIVPRNTFFNLTDDYVSIFEDARFICVEEDANEQTGTMICDYLMNFLGCRKGFYFDSVDEACYPCKVEHSNSLNCTAEEALECEYGFYLKDGECNPCQYLHQNSDHCTADESLKCKQGFLLNDGNCQPCAERFEGALICNSVEALTCKEEFYLQDGHCRCPDE